MPGATKFDKHARLMARMGDALGVDLELEVQTGRISEDDLETMTQSCVGCPDPMSCGHLLDRTDALSDAPDYCRNKAILEKLRG